MAPRSEPILSAADEGLPAAGLVLWLRADVGVRVDDDGKVCHWEDQSGKGFDLTQPTAAARPIGVADLSGKPAVDLDVGQSLSRRDVLGIGATSGRTIVAAYALDNPRRRFFVGQGQDVSNRVWLGLDDNTYQTRGGLHGCYVTDNSYDGDIATTTAIRVRTWWIDSLTPGLAISDHFRCRVDGSDMGLTSTSARSTVTESFSAANTTIIGADGLGDARIAELLVYDHGLSPEDLETVETVLAQRYGVSLAP